MATALVNDSPPNRFADAALHNGLILLESRHPAAELNGSPQLLCASSRLADSEVEFVNHPEAVSLCQHVAGIRVRGSGAGELLK
jgi:hypothetical protein